MTGQISDHILYDDIDFTVCAFSNPHPFLPEKWGYAPYRKTTACWRGYALHFSVRDNFLCLKEMIINNQPDRDNHASALKQPPSLNKVEAVRLEDHSPAGNWRFEDVNLPLNYSGGIILGAEYLQGFRMRGFPSFGGFKTVVELIFEKGELVYCKDVSHYIGRIRAKNKNNPHFYIRNSKLPKTISCFFEEKY